MLGFLIDRFPRHKIDGDFFSSWTNIKIKHLKYQRSKLAPSWTFIFLRASRTGVRGGVRVCVCAGSIFYTQSYGHVYRYLKINA